MRLFAGLDPGASGAVVIIDEDAAFVDALRFEGYDCPRVFQWLARYSGSVTLAAIERVGAMPQDGKASLFDFGKSVGALEMALAALKMPRLDVLPAAWQASAGIVKPQRVKESDLPADERSMERRIDSARAKSKRLLKRAIYEHAMRRWPTLPIRTQLDWAIADGACLADHARRHFLGEALAKPTRAPRNGTVAACDPGQSSLPSSASPTSP